MAQNRAPAPPCRRAAPRSEFGEREFDVFAGAEIIGRKVQACAKVVAGCRAAHGDAVVSASLGIAHAELRKHRLAAEIGQLETLLAAELSAQRALPVVGRHGRRLALARQARRGWWPGFGFGFGLPTVNASCLHTAPSVIAVRLSRDRSGRTIARARPLAPIPQPFRDACFSTC